MGQQVRNRVARWHRPLGLCDVVLVMALGPVGRTRARQLGGLRWDARAASLFAAASLTLGSVAGCAQSVAIVPPTSPGPEVTRACEALASALPDDLDPIGRRRAVTPESPLTAAWGDPPAAMRCGVATPAALTPTATLVEVNGVDWFAEELTDGHLMTTVGRVANVELTVARENGPAPSMAAGLAEAIKATVPKKSAG